MMSSPVSSDPPKPDFDVLIVGAGISGISAGCHLRMRCPDKRFVILEARDSFGGTWDLFRYPGIRSDSDMHTFGFSFKPWTSPKAIADGPSIKAYLEETINEYNLAPHIQYHRRVTRADWRDEDAFWAVQVRNGAGETETLTARIVFMCSGYYRYDAGYLPDIPGLEAFRGVCIHPQHWPENLDYTDKRVAVIGSGATAVTLVPAMAGRATLVTMIQRSPSWVVSRPLVDRVARWLNRLLPERWAYALLRWRNIRLQNFIYKRARNKPEKVSRMLLKLLRKNLGDDFAIETHFTPSYPPWTQRLCLVPDADLFRALREDKARVVTGQIAQVEEQGVRMQSGDFVEADILITATGLRLQLMGGVGFSCNGETIDFSQRYFYQGMMFSGVPNLLQTFGYVNASWTLRADLNSQWLCDLLDHMDATGTRMCTPQPGADEKDMPAKDWVTGFNPGYMRRALHLFPRQGDHVPWLNTQDYLLDRKLLRHDVERSEALRFS